MYITVTVSKKKKKFKFHTILINKQNIYSSVTLCNNQKRPMICMSLRG